MPLAVADPQMVLGGGAAALVLWGSEEIRAFFWQRRHRRLAAADPQMVLRGGAAALVLLGSEEIRAFWQRRHRRPLRYWRQPQREAPPPMTPGSLSSGTGDELPCG